MKKKLQMGKTFFFLFVTMGLYLTIPKALGQPTELITAYGSEFNLSGQAFRFTGVNIRGICHYGKGDILPYTQESHIEENLNGVVAMGGKVVRLFAPCKFATHQENVNRLKNVLDKMETKGLTAIVCLTDLYNSGFCPQGDGSYYMAQPGGWTLLDDTWFQGGYKNNYKPYVELAVNQLKNHNAIFAWEIGNELTDIKTPNAIIDFTADMASAIKAIDPWHMVTTGFLAVDHTQIGEQKGYDLYADQNIDFITVHCYNGEDHVANWAVHSRLGKPLVLEEFGWSSDHGNRVTNTQAQMEQWYANRAARGFMNWGYQAQSYDIGDGDNIYGIDQYAHTDYTELVNVYSNRSTQIADNPITLPGRLEPEGTNVAPFSIAWQADSTYSGDYGGDKVYDEEISGESKWTSNGTAPPHWVAIDLGRTCSIDGVTLRMSGAANEYVAFNFRAFQVQTADTLSGPWSTDFTVNNPARFSFHHCLYESPKEFRCLRIYVTDAGIDNYARLPEIEVYELRTDAKSWIYY